MASPFLATAKARKLILHELGRLARLFADQDALDCLLALCAPDSHGAGA
jgi:hypothetical protein